MLRRRLDRALVLTLLLGCAPAPVPVAARDYPLEASALLHGLGAARVCRSDRDCQEGQVRSVCTLGTCFGLLTTDERVTRALLVERLALAGPRVHAEVRKPLLTALSSDTTTNGQKMAAIDGLAAAAPTPPNDELLVTLRLFAANPDEALAATARLALGRLGDVTVRSALLEDLTHGTELLRAEAARALQPAVSDTAVRQALALALQDSSPVVQLAALRALTPVAHQPGIAGKLAELAARTPAFRYEVEQLLAGGAK